jgi:hypothetical protein
MFFLAEAIFGTKESPKTREIRGIREAWNLGSESTKVKAR